jgi:hypothetical protein
MSLIQDALKRQSEEDTGIRPPAIPAEKPELPTEEKGPRPSFTMLSIVIIAGLIAVLAGLGIYLIKPRALPQQVAQPAAPAATPAPSTASVSVAVSAPAASAPVAVPEPPPVQAVTTAKVEAVTAKAEPVIEPVKKEEPAPVIPIEWPKLSLTGIAQNDNQSIAILNGKMLTVGRTLGEVTIREVNSTDVVVEFRGERRTLYINE